MGTPTWAIPVGVLGGLIACMLVFMWWWFPRAWQKGVNSDVREASGPVGVDANVRELQRARNRAIIERHERKIKRDRGEAGVPEDDQDLEMALNWGRAPRRDEEMGVEGEGLPKYSAQETVSAASGVAGGQGEGAR